MRCPSCSNADTAADGGCPACGFRADGAVPSVPAGLGLAAQILLGAQVLGEGLSVLGNSMLIGANSSTGTGRTISGTGTELSSVAMFASIVVFLIWFAKTRKTAEQLSPGAFTGLSSRWAVGGWFVPVAFAWIPRRITGDIWAASRPLEQSSAQPRRSGLLTAWWTAWCLMWPAAMVNGALITGARNNLNPNYDAVEGSAIVSSLCHGGAAVLAILVIRKITSMQQARVLQGGGQGHPLTVQAPVVALGTPSA